MRALVQRVSEASVKIDGEVVGEIGHGMLVLVCAMEGDTDELPAKLAAKLSKMRIFQDDAGKMNKSLVDVGGSALIVSQFTLSADTSRGNRPGFSAAARPAEGERLYEMFKDEVAKLDIPTACGRFGADMKVSLINDGPVTIWTEV
ncbi:D-aminoacyl-tRNA deacylase [Marivivens aquimaris]|uniref:D-aminoacyl-tRNA deacylase n=1 Tax=Marivivens aquimaris TaxID=2774876 RepID=UPI00188195C4|nr:D-aminoacyl-tRNA deacylase [Marivivens aquimaris]